MLRSSDIVIVLIRSIFQFEKICFVLEWLLSFASCFELSPLNGALKAQKPATIITLFCARMVALFCFLF